jgi:hypothetical protein
MQSLHASSSSRCQAFRPASRTRNGRQLHQLNTRVAKPVRALPDALLFDCDGVRAVASYCCAAVSANCENSNTRTCLL